jgi:hypothetical protein
MFFKDKHYIHDASDGCLSTIPYHVAEVGLELMVLLPQPPKC